ncbi:hypothetical protein N9H39_02035 [Gammaproteobacteria bacterium]|nr:hypothetical protein [Gammaproteobacteria bacterium]
MTRFPIICPECQKDFDAMTSDGVEGYSGGIGFCQHFEADNSPAAGVLFIVIAIGEGGYQIHITAPLTLAEAMEKAEETKAAFEGDDVPTGATVQ